MPDGSPQLAIERRAPPQGFLRKYVFSLDHKVIGKQYYGLSLIAVSVGMVLSWLMRFHLAWPKIGVVGLDKLSPAGAPGGVITPEYYLSLMTMHATIMVFFVLTTVPIGGFGNYFLPIQIGAKDMAFPRLNMLSFWITFVSFLVLIAAFFVADGPPISGWTAYPPLSAVGKDAGPGEGLGQNLWAISIAIFCVGQLFGSLNFITTTLDLRTKGMTLARMPLSVWAWFITSVMALISFAVLLPACILLILDRVAGAGFFVPAGLIISDHLQPHAGGSPLLWQHLFWFFGHPEVYIAICVFWHCRFNSACVRSKTAFGITRRDRVLDRHRISQFRRVGTPYVRERNESLFSNCLFVADDDHHNSFNDYCPHC